MIDRQERLAMAVARRLTASIVAGVHRRRTLESTTTHRTQYATHQTKTPCYTATVSHNTPQVNTKHQATRKTRGDANRLRARQPATLMKRVQLRNTSIVESSGLCTCCWRRSCCSPSCGLWIAFDSRGTLLPAERADNVAAMFSPKLWVPVRGKRFKASCKRETQTAIAFWLEGGVSFTRYLQGNANSS